MGWRGGWPPRRAATSRPRPTPPHPQPLQPPAPVPEVTAADQAAINEFNRLFQKAKEVAAEVKAKKVCAGEGWAREWAWMGGRRRPSARSPRLPSALRPPLAPSPPSSHHPSPQSLLDDLDDAAAEIALTADAEEPVRFVVGECFFHFPGDAAEARAEAALDAARASAATAEAEGAGLEEKVGALKARLYARLGDSINLEA